MPFAMSAGSLKEWADEHLEPDAIVELGLEKPTSETLDKLIEFISGKGLPELENLLFSLIDILPEHFSCERIVESLDKAVEPKSTVPAKKLIAGQVALEFLLPEERWDQCLARVSKLLEAASEAGLKEEEAILYNYRGVCLYRLARYPEAKQALENSLQIAESTGSNRRISRASINLGLVLKEMGKLEEAADYYKRGLRISRETGDKRTLLSCYLNIGNIYKELGRWGEGRKALESGIQLAREAGNLLEESRGRLNLGVLLLESGENLEQAEELFRQVIKDSPNHNSGLLESIAYSNLAQTLVELGRPKESIEITKKNLQRSEKSRDVEGIWRDNANLARALIGLGKYEFADQNFRKALVEFDKLITSLDSDRDRAQFQRNLQNLGDEFVRFAIDKMRPESSYARLAIAKGRGLSHSRGARRMLFHKDPDKLTERIQEWLGKNPGTGLIDYFIDGEDIRIFVVTPGDVKMEKSGFTYGEFEKKLPELEAEINLFIASGEYRSAGFGKEFDPPEIFKSLYEILIEPVMAGISEVKQLYIVPSRGIFRIPFNGLATAGGEYLCEDKAVCVLPSGDFFLNKELPKYKENQVIGLKGFTEGLLQVESELEALIKIFGDKFQPKSIDGLASKDFEKAEAIHFAGHAEFDVSDPFASSITLENGDKIEVHDLVENRLNLDAISLVTLSACESGTTRVLSGDEITGISRGFLSAGVSSVVSSLWKVDDQATSMLMVEFYQHWRHGDLPGIALQKSMMKMLESRRFHPYFFAPFQVMGI
jgi:tetratricopeptide (TPR) repeat protein